jgi:hypothetical protein
MDLALVQHASLLDPSKVHQRRFGRHRDNLAQRANAELHVDHGHLAGRQRDARLLVAAETLQLRGKAVRAERQQRSAEYAALVGDDDTCIAGVGVGDGHGNARQNASRIVGDAAFDGAVDGLPLRGCGGSKREREQKRKSYPEHGRNLHCS